MRHIILTLLLISSVLLAHSQSFYDLSATTIDGKPFHFSELKGKKVMVVNTASKCGLTPQYKELEALYQKYGGARFTIIGFPANNFMEQEPGTDKEILEFCQKNYGVTFQMMSKISVKGDDMHPVYQWLTKKVLNGLEDNEVKWNFQKYLVDEDGALIKVVSPREKPDSEAIISWILGK